MTELKSSIEIYDMYGNMIFVLNGWKSNEVKKLIEKVNVGKADIKFQASETSLTYLRDTLNERHENAQNELQKAFS